MIETIYCGKRTVWLYTRPRHTARYAIKKTVAWREYNYLNGFELPTDNSSCIYYRRWLLLCLCVRIAHRNNVVPPGRRHIRHCRSSCVWLNKTHFIETFVDTPRTYHWFSYGHVGKCMYDVNISYIKWRLHKVRISVKFLLFHRGADLRSCLLLEDSSLHFFR